jgi:hypothetical protein
MFFNVNFKKSTMAKKSNKPMEDSHDQLRADETTRKKIDKHLSDIEDTISEQDIKNINTDTGNMVSEDHHHDIEEADEILKEKRGDDEEPEKEAPSTWEILGE